MKLFFVKHKEDYRFTLSLATLFHILLFFVFFFTLRHSIKPFFLRAAAPPPIIQATALDSRQLPVSDIEKEKVKPLQKVEKIIIKPVFVEKSPVALPNKEKKPLKMAADTTSLVAKSHLKSSVMSKKKQRDKLRLQHSVKEEKNGHHSVAQKSLQSAQKSIQQLLQQEVNTLVQKQQVTQRNRAVTEKYRHLILQSIAQQWIVPPELNKKLETKLMVKLAPGGMVLEVVIVKTSGNPVLDRSAQTAVYKASPLPVPKNNLFNTFRQINLSVRPEGILTQ